MVISGHRDNNREHIKVISLTIVTPQQRCEGLLYHGENIHESNHEQNSGHTRHRGYKKYYAQQLSIDELDRAHKC